MSINLPTNVIDMIIGYLGPKEKAAQEYMQGIKLCVAIKSNDHKTASQILKQADRGEISICSKHIRNAWRLTLGKKDLGLLYRFQLSKQFKQITTESIEKDLLAYAKKGLYPQVKDIITFTSSFRKLSLDTLLEIEIPSAKIRALIEAKTNPEGRNLLDLVDRNLIDLLGKSPSISNQTRFTIAYNAAFKLARKVCKLFNLKISEGNNYHELTFKVLIKKFGSNDQFLEKADSWRKTRNTISKWENKKIGENDIREVIFAIRAFRPDLKSKLTASLTARVRKEFQSIETTLKEAETGQLRLNSTKFCVYYDAACNLAQALLNAKGIELKDSMMHNQEMFQKLNKIGLKSIQESSSLFIGFGKKRNQIIHQDEEVSEKELSGIKLNLLLFKYSVICEIAKALKPPY